jgi:hypothetical protein
MSLTSHAAPRTARRLRGMFLWGALLAALVPFSVDCGGGDDDDNGAGPGTDVCSTVYQGQCGVTCSEAAPCASGLFCSNGACTAQCTAATGCGDGLVCSPNGRCVSPGAGGTGGTGGGGLPVGGSSGSGGGGVSGSSTGGAGGVCAQVSANFQPVIPAVMLVADRSASMSCPINNAAETVDGNNKCAGVPADADSPTSRWRTFKDSLLPFIEQKQEEVIFGVTFYPRADNTCNAEGQSTVTLRAGAFDEIESAYNSKEPGGQTPTGAGLSSAINQIKAVTDLPPGTPKFIILASDGSPHCGNDSSGDAQQQAAAVGAVGAAFDEGIRTFVIAIGELFTANPAKAAQFQALADAGFGRGKPGGLPQDQAGPLYPVTDTDELNDALTTIINSVRPCSFSLDVALQNPAVDGPRGTVTIDGQNVPFNTADGWKLVGNDSIEFGGAACTQIRGPGSRDVKASFPCDVQTTTPPPRPPPPR